MLGRKTFTQQELDHAKASMDAQLGAYDDLVAAIDTDNPEVKQALEAFEPLFCNNLTLALDRRFVHRLRVVTGKDANPLNEVELITDSLLNNGDVLHGSTVIKYKPEQTVVKLDVGEPIALSADDYKRLSAAFLGDIDAKFV
jgi:hypothetical protein